MKAQVIRKDWGEDTFNALKVEVSLLERAIKNDIKTFDINSFDIVFLHVNNEEAEIFFKGLTENEKSKLILFSTGGKPNYQWCIDYPFFMSSIGSWELFKRLNWNNISTKLDRQEIIERLKKNKTNYLIALSILCQGYLAAHGGAGLRSEIPDDLKAIAQGNWEKVKGSWWDIVKTSDSIQQEIDNLNSEIKINGEHAKGKIQK